MIQEAYKNPLPLVEGEGKRKNGPIMGLDMHKNVIAYCITSEQRILLEGAFQNNSDERKELIKLCRHYKVRSVAMEATSQYHFPMMFDLVDANIHLLVANPQQTKNTQGKKTDKLDARRIALAHRDGRLRPSVVPPRAIVDLRRNNRALIRLIQDQTRFKQRIQQFFHLHGFDLRPVLKTRDFLTTKWTLDLFYAMLTSDGMISKLIDQFYPGHPSKRSQTDQHKINVLIRALTQFRQALSSMERQILTTYVIQLQMNQQMQNQHRQLNYQFVKAHPPVQKPLKILLSIQGIGPDTAFVLLGELVDIRYFSTAPRLVKWAGLAPKVYQSGQRKHKTGKIHKGGNKYVRRALTLACSNIYARGDETHPIYRLIQAKYQQTDKYWLAVCAGSRKLLSIIWYLLNTDQRWQPRTLQDSELLPPLLQKIDRKIQLCTRQIDRCEKLRQRLTQRLGKQLERWKTITTDPNHLLKDLLRAV